MANEDPLEFDLSQLQLSAQDDEEAERTINHFIDILENHRKQCEQQGKYVEAEVARNRLKEIREYEENRRREKLRTAQLAERMSLEEAHMREFEVFNAEWDNHMNEYESRAEALVENMKARHSELFQQHQEEIRRKVPLRPKFSKELLNLRRIQQSLAKQKSYAEAHQIKAKADSLEEWEMSKENKVWLEKIDKLEKTFLAKQQAEMGALIKRIQTGREEQNKLRETEMNRLMQRYQNSKNILESQQNIERLRAEKYISALFSATNMAPANSSATISNPPPPERPARNRTSDSLDSDLKRLHIDDSPFSAPVAPRSARAGAQATPRARPSTNAQTSRPPTSARAATSRTSLESDTPRTSRQANVRTSASFSAPASRSRTEGSTPRGATSRTNQYAI